MQVALPRRSRKPVPRGRLFAFSVRRPSIADEIQAAVESPFEPPTILKGNPLSIDLYAGIQVSSCLEATRWYERLLGCPPTFVAGDTEVVWDLAEHRAFFIHESVGHAGHSVLSVFVDDLDERVAAISQRGIEPTKRETYDNGVRKVEYTDPDGNVFGFGAVPSP